MLLARHSVWALTKVCFPAADMPLIHTFAVEHLKLVDGWEMAGTDATAKAAIQKAVEQFDCARKFLQSNKTQKGALTEDIIAGVCLMAKAMLVQWAGGINSMSSDPLKLVENGYFEAASTSPLSLRVYTSRELCPDGEPYLVKGPLDEHGGKDYDDVDGTALLVKQPGQKSKDTKLVVLGETISCDRGHSIDGPELKETGATKATKAKWTWIKGKTARNTTGGVLPHYIALTVSGIHRFEDGSKTRLVGEQRKLHVGNLHSAVLPGNFSTGEVKPPVTHVVRLDDYASFVVTVRPRKEIKTPNVWHWLGGDLLQQQVVLPLLPNLATAAARRHWRNLGYNTTHPCFNLKQLGEAVAYTAPGAFQAWEEAGKTLPWENIGKTEKYNYTPGTVRGTRATYVSNDDSFTKNKAYLIERVGGKGEEPASSSDDSDSEADLVPPKTTTQPVHNHTTANQNRNSGPTLPSQPANKPISQQANKPTKKSSKQGATNKQTNKQTNNLKQTNGPTNKPNKKPTKKQSTCTKKRRAKGSGSDSGEESTSSDEEYTPARSRGHPKKPKTSKTSKTSKKTQKKINPTKKTTKAPQSRTKRATQQTLYDAVVPKPTAARSQKKKTKS